MRARPFALAALLALAAPAAHAKALSVPLNHSIQLHLSGPAQSVVVGSPSVVDVSVVDSRTVFVSGKSPGDTDVTVIDPLGRVVFRGDVVVAGGSAVSVFRGAARTDAMCAPYCRSLPQDDGTTQAALGAGAMSSVGASAAAPASMASTRPTGTVMNAQTIASVPQAMPLAH